MQLWNEYFVDMHTEWFKLEALQDYSGEDDVPSLHAWKAGDKQKALELLRTAPRNQWHNRCQTKVSQGALLRRVRIIEQPYTPYTEWELAYYAANNMVCGEQIFLVDKPAVADITLPDGDLTLFDNKRAVIWTYDNAGRVTSGTFYDGDDISAFLTLKDQVLKLARKL